MEPIIKDLGKVRPTIEGDYNSELNYEVLSIVFTKEKAYISKKETPANTPLTDEEYWMFFGLRKTVIDRGTGQTISAILVDANNIASGDFSVALGNQCKALGFGAFVCNSENEASGNNSHAEGYKTKATHADAHAEGGETIASGINSHAEGYATKTTNYQSHAEGSETESTGIASHSEGMKTKATGTASHAEGAITSEYRDTSQMLIQAGGIGSHAEGHAHGFYPYSTNFAKIIASGNGSHAEGYAESHGPEANIEASGNGSHAEGYANSQFSVKASGIGSHAEGCYTQALGNGSHTEGQGTVAKNDAEHAEGKYNKSNKRNVGTSEEIEALSTIHSVGIGSPGGHERNAHEIMQNGDHYIYGLGNYNGANPDIAKTLQEVINSKIDNTVNNLINYYLKSETYSKSEVQALIGAINQFHYEVYPTLPQTGSSNVLYLIGPIGTGFDKYEEYVYANNDWTKIGDTSINLNDYVTIAAFNAALANYTLAANVPVELGTGINSIQQKGTQCDAHGNYSCAEGNQTTADGEGAHAEGMGGTAEGDGAHAEGFGTLARNQAAHAEGLYTETNHIGEHAEGNYNLSNSGNTGAENTLHSVGFGYRDVPAHRTVRKNAHEIMENGDHYIYGIGGYDGTNAISEDVFPLADILPKVAYIPTNKINTSITVNEYNNIISSNFIKVQNFGIFNKLSYYDVAEYIDTFEILLGSDFDSIGSCFGDISINRTYSIESAELVILYTYNQSYYIKQISI